MMAPLRKMKKAMINCQHKLTTAEQTPVDNDPRTARRLRSLALEARAQGQHHEAQALLLQSLRTIEEGGEEAAGAPRLDLVSALNRIARMHIDRDEYLEAEQPLERAIVILEGAGGTVEVEKLHVWSLGNLAEAYRLQGHY